MKSRLAVVALLLMTATAGAAEPEEPAAAPVASAEQAAQQPAEQPAEEPVKPVPLPVYPLTAEDMLRRLEETERRLQELSLRAEEAEEVVEEPSRPLLGAFPQIGEGVGQIDATAPSPDIGVTRKWFDLFSLRGYVQNRHNNVPYLEPGSAPPQHVGDRSVQDNQNFLIRRARLLLDGDIGDHMRVYIQTDFASNVPGVDDAFHYGQIRDWYADVFLDKDQVHRFRVGQSKVPYGWVNLQSSSNRAPLDRDDGMNSATPGERDLGIFYYWTPVGAQKMFSYVLRQNLKGTGNYGVFGFGAYNGQGASLQEQNDNLHVVARATYPFLFENGQILEMSLQGYTGKFTVFGADINPLGGPDTIVPFNTRDEGGRPGVREERAAVSAILYPQPVGLQVEWNVGRGPALDPTQTFVEQRHLYGGYAMLIGKVETPTCGICFPYYRWSYFKGGYKVIDNAPFSLVSEHEMGLEWQPWPYLELTCAYAFTDRTNERAVDDPGVIPYEQFRGQILRIQLQFNY